MGENDGDMSDWGRDSSKSVTPAPPEPVSALNVPVEAGKEVTSPSSNSSQEGVQVGGLTYTENGDGTRNYPDQEPVQTTGDPTPTPEVKDSGIQDTV